MANAGDIVSVTGAEVQLDDLSDEILVNVNLARSLIAQFLGLLNSSITNLNDLVGEYDPEIRSIATTLPTISGPGFPTRPSFGALNLDTSWPDRDISQPVMRDFGILDFNLVVPSPPAEVDESFTWTERNYSSDMWQALFSTVHTAILSGSYGFSDAVHAAFVAREQETRRRNQDREFRAALAAVGSTGFNFSGGRKAGVLAEFAAEVLQRDQDALNNLTEKDFQIAFEREKLYIGSGIGLEQLVRDTFKNAEDRSLDAAKAAKEYIARFLAENIRLFLGKYEGEKLRLEGLRAKVEAIASVNKNETDVFLGRAQVLEATYKAISEKNKSIVDARRGEIDTYAAEVGAVRDQYLALVEEIKVQQAAITAEINRDLKVEELKLMAYSEKAKLGQSTGLAVSQIYAQGLASSAGMINTSLANSYSGHENRSTSWDVNLNEAYHHSVPAA